MIWRLKPGKTQEGYDAAKQAILEDGAARMYELQEAISALLNERFLEFHEYAEESYGKGEEDGGTAGEENQS